MSFKAKFLLALFLLSALPALAEWSWRRKGHGSGRSLTRYSQRAEYLDREVGLRLLPNLDGVSQTREEGGAEIWKTRFSTDGRGRRRIPRPKPDTAKRFAAFFGGSFAFGEGLEDDQTLPHHFSRLQHSWAVYNHAGFGYGPNQMLAQLSDAELRNDIPEERGIALYVYNSEQIRRAAGTMKSSQEAPCFELENSILSRKGLFRDSRPFLNMLYALLGQSELYGKFGPDLPARLGEPDLDLTCALINSSSRHFLKSFPRSFFAVLILRDYPGESLDIRPCLDRLNLTYFDYYDRLVDRGRFTLPDGNLPSDYGNQYLASLLAQDLAALLPPE